jgi:MFS family permease
VKTGQQSLGPLLLAEVTSTLGSEISGIALSWFVLIRTGSAAQMSLVLAADFAGIIVFGLPGGKLPAALGARRAMMASDLIRGGLTALVPLLAWTDRLSLPLLLVIVFAVGGFFGAYESSQRLLLSEIAAHEESALIRGGGILGSVNEAASFGGPAIGGFLIALAGPTAALLFDAASYLVAFGIIFLLTQADVPPARNNETVGGLFAGLRFLRRDPILWPLTVSVSVMELAWTAMFAALPVLAFREFEGSVKLAGWFLAAYGGGSVAGGLIAARSASRIDLRIVPFAVVGVAVAMWTLVFPLPAWGVVSATAMTGVFTGVYFPPLTAGLTLRPPEPIRAHVLSAATTIMSIMGPIGFIWAGLLLERYRSTTPTFVLIGGIATVAAGLSVIALLRGGRGKRPGRPRESSAGDLDSPGQSRG